LSEENKDLIDKICRVKKPPPKTVKVNLCAHYEGSGKINTEELIKQLEMQTMQIINLSKTLESLRKEHLEYFNKATMQEQTIFMLS
jgi:hypothetical protein